MAIVRAHGTRKNGILKLKILVEKVQRSLALTRKSSTDFEEFWVLDKSATSLPGDVKQGHFAVIAVDNGKPKRFVIQLSYLHHPSFLKLLEQAAEEFGFSHQGALSIPCRWSELEGILAA